VYDNVADTTTFTCPLTGISTATPTTADIALTGPST
jgi:hypothetical protein